MDPVAHTLFGAALAESGLKKTSRYATASLLIGVNLPDIDVVSYIWGSDTALLVRRGWSHGILALILLPLILSGGLWLWHRWRMQKGAVVDRQPPFRLGAIIALCYLAIASHSLLDWMNTYGVRLLMPFDGRWFYGDTLFIIDPWLWLLPAAGVLMVRSDSFKTNAVWSALAIFATGMILTQGYASVAVILAWFAALAVVIGFRLRAQSKQLSQPLTRVSGLVLFLYVGVAYGVARQTETAAADRFGPPVEAQTNPLPGAPFSHRVILAYETSYQVILPNGEVHTVPRKEASTVVQAALATESIRGFVNWMRFPYWAVNETSEGWHVSIWDLRYQGPGAPEAPIGFAEVVVPKDGVDRF